jgi:microcystin-dependent protein
MNMLQRQFGIMSSLSMGEGREFSNYAIGADIPHGGVVYNWNAVGDLKDYTGQNGQWSNIQSIRDEILKYNTVVFAYYEQAKDSIVRIQVDAAGAVFFISPEGGHITVTESGLKGSLYDIIFPVGSILAFAGTTTPTGWLWCNGEAVSRITYSTLFTVCGIAYGQGDGFSTFNLPDFRNRVLEGGANMDTRSYIDAGLPSMIHNHVGTSDTSGGHAHTFTSSSAGAHTHSVSVGSAGGHTHTRGTMDIKGTFTAYQFTGFSNKDITATGAFGYTGGSLYGGNQDTADRSAIMTFDASKNWTGETSNNGAHSHTGSAGNAGAHIHSGTSNDSGEHSHTITVANNTDSGVYGKSDTVQPAACTCNYIIKF